MAKSKAIDRVCAIAIAVMLVVTALVWAGKAAAGPHQILEMGYEDLFDKSYVHQINIEMAQDDWNAFIRSATMEEYVECSVTIDGEKLSNVAIRAKGNTSLSSVSSMGSQKYSFKIEFDHFVKGRLYHNLDKLSLNNLIYDATMMKDYLAYTLMGKMGVPSPLCSFVEVKVNGEVWGLYLAVEGVEDGFLDRNNMTTGDLYKPDSLSFGGGRGNGGDFDIDQFRVEDEEGGDTANQAGDAQGNNDFAGSDGGSAGGQSREDGSEGRQGGEQTESSGRPAETDESASPNDTDNANQQNNAWGQNTGDEWAASDGDANQQTGNTDWANGEDWAASDGETAEGRDWGGSGGDSANADGEGDGFGASGGGQGGGFGFNFGMGSSDVKLQYSDDRVSSYSNIFGSAKTDVTEKDQTRMIEALKTLNGVDGADPKDAVFTDEVIHYLVVHDFLQNGDSYTGMMVHNYYLYEEDGKLAIIPWDYNLAFGGMTGTDASSVINSPIDNPVSDGTGSDRPLVYWIISDEESLAQYHEVYDQFVSEIIESGWLENELTRVYEMLRPYVEEDPNGFFSVEDYDVAVDAMQQYCSLRGQSVRGQLDGTIPATSAGQRTNSASLIKTGDLDIKVMGSMNGNRGGNRTEGDDNGSGGSRGDSASDNDGEANAPANDGNANEWNAGGAALGNGEASAGDAATPANDGAAAPENGGETIPGEEGAAAPAQGWQANDNDGQERAQANGDDSNGDSGGGSAGGQGGDENGSWDRASFSSDRTSNSTTRMSWGTFAIYVGVLAAAIVIAFVVRGKNS